MATNFEDAKKENEEFLDKQEGINNINIDSKKIIFIAESKDFAKFYIIKNNKQSVLRFLEKFRDEDVERGYEFEGALHARKDANKMMDSLNFLFDDISCGRKKFLITDVDRNRELRHVIEKASLFSKSMTDFINSRI